MPGWANVVTRFKAKGDGKKDDTRSLQTALDSLTCRPMKFNTGETGFTVVYLPKGRYKITETLVLRGKIGIQIIGEDPANTIIEWGGNDNDTMFWSNGSAYFKLSRIGFNASEKKGIRCVGIHWKDYWTTPQSRSFAALNMELSDPHFSGKPAIGISGGTYGGGGKNGTGNNDSEITIRRNVFNSCTDAGIRIMGYNALEYWVWDSRFLDCNIGIASSFGNYHAYRSYFRNSKVADFYHKAGYYTSVRFCYSENSRAFSLDEGNSSNPFKRVFQGNVVIQPAVMPIQYYHVGSLTLLDNKIESPKDSSSPFIVNHRSWAPVNYQMLSVGNSWGKVKTPLRIGTQPHKIFSVNDHVLLQKPSSGQAFLAGMPVTPPYVKRRIFVVPRGGDDKVIQSLITKAAALKGQRPVIHFPLGEYKLKKSLTVPPGADIQFTGDGLRYASIIRAEDPKQFRGKPLFLVQGPSYVTFSELQFGTASVYNGTAISFEKIDQGKAEIRMDQIYSQADTTLFVDKLNNAYFEKNNSFFSAGNVIIGGKNLAKGNGRLQVHCFGGQYAGLVVRNNASFVSKDCWYEGKIKVPLDLSGDGRVTIDGAKIAPNPLDSMPILRIRDFKGKVSLMNMYVQGGMEVSKSNPNLEMLVWNANFYYKKDIAGTVPRGFNGMLAYLGITTQCFYENDPYCKMIKSVNNRSVNISDENKFLAGMVADTRNSVPRYYRDLGAGVTNILLTRVSFDSFHSSLWFKE